MHIIHNIPFLDDDCSVYMLGLMAHAGNSTYILCMFHVQDTYGDHCLHQKFSKLL